MSKAALFKFFRKRGISPETVEWYGVHLAEHDFGDGVPRRPAIVFPYRSASAVTVGRKFRPPSGTPEQVRGEGKPVLFGAEGMEAPDILWWTEHEISTMALAEVGYRQTVCLPGSDDESFGALETHEEMLGKTKRIVLAVAATPEGDALREELARRLGRHRCWLVTWPEGAKDASETLVEHGPEALQQVLERAEPYPIEGLQKVKPGALLGLRHGKPPPTMSTGTRAMDLILKWPGEGRLIILTGIPSHGKTSLVNFSMVHLMINHKRRFVVFSPENQPWEEYAARIGGILVGKSFWPRRGLTSDKIMSDLEIRHAEDWLRERLTLLVSDAEETAPSLPWILDRAKMSVLRDGATDLVIDPWNELAHDRPKDMSETDYIGRSLQQGKAFALRYGVNLWIIVHPKSPIGFKMGAVLPAPGPYDINGGANWANKADIGVTVYTPDTLTEIRLWKSRFSRWGRRGSVAKVEFDEITGRYTSPIQTTLLAPGDPMARMGERPDE